MSGFGKIATTCGTGSFQIDVKRKQSGAFGGTLGYEDPGADIKLHSTKITSLMVAGDTADVTGTCLEEGTPCTFAVHVVGNGAPNSFRITAVGPSIPPGYDEDGPLNSGRIRVSSG